MGNKEYEMAIKIAGQIEKSFYESTKLTRKELSQIAKAASTASLSTSEAFSKGLRDAEPMFSAIENAGVKAMKAVTTAATATAAAVTGVAVASINVGSEFESAFAGVRKTVEATEAEYAQMENSIREMATNIPTTASELSGIAEAAGQLGIAKENIVEFSKTMADMDVATNMTSEDAATNFARFANITGMSQDKFDELGSTVVSLGNNLATTESEIVEMSMRLAGAGAQVNLSEAQIMGMAAALSSVGIEAEMGGSAFSKLMVNLQLAVETGNDSLTQYAKVAGMTSKEFKKAFNEDAASAISSFLSGLNNTERNGMSAIAVLDDMGITEVRMRDALLRASNASDVFNKSLNIANSAWEKNIALTNEAEQRYKTFDSQKQMTVNNLTDMGIETYQSMRGSLTEGLYAINNELFTSMRDTFIDSGAVENTMNDLEKKIPTLIRETKELGESISDFSEPFLAVGGWLVDNPGVITGTIVGIGSALSVYKVANGIMAMTSALSALGPVGIGILAIGGVAGVIVGIGTAVKKSAEEAKKANLAGHFGDIALSLADLNEAADFIIYTDNLGKIREALEQFDGLDTLQKSIDDSVSTINKMNWKVSIGMELSETEMNDYRSSIENYVQQCQQYATDQQYAMTMAVGVLTDDDLEGQNIVNQLNHFYANKQDELAQLGTDLNNAITDAFQDGLLDIDEAARISEIQAQMAEVQAQLAGGNFEASMEVLSAKYGGNLNAESFQNLQAELAEKVEEAKTSYEEAYQSAVSGQLAMLQDGRINQQTYDSNVAEFRENYLEQLGQIETKAAGFQIETIMNQYADEIAAAKPQLQAIQEEVLKYADQTFSAEGMGNTADRIGAVQQYAKDTLKSEEILPEDTRAAISELLSQASPAMEQMNESIQEYRANCQAIPKEMQEIMDKAIELGSLTGDTSSIWQMTGNTLLNDEDYETLLKSEYEKGTYLPKEITNGILDNQAVLQEAASQTWVNAVQYMEGEFEKGIDVTLGVRIKTNFQSTAEGMNKIPMPQSLIGNTGIPGYANGGIISQPTLAWFAEKGPEAAIPLDGSQNAINLWMQAGELLGMQYSNSGNGLSALSKEINNSHYTTDNSAKIEFKPELNFYGESPRKEDLDSAFDTALDRFDEMMNNWLKEKGRVSFKPS